ncbi:MAG: SAM-dependent methyltransferase [Phycisphaerales bacterium]
MPSQARLRAQVAASVDAPSTLLPFFPQLFHGLDCLGSEPERVLALATRVSPDPDTTIIDLASGKGGIAVALAQRFHCHIMGIDACRAFVQAADSLAHRLGEHDRCHFRVGDARRARKPHDAALMLGLFGFEKAAPLLHRLVRPGGWYILDDALARRTHSSGSIPTMADALDTFHALGDQVLATSTPSRAEIALLDNRLESALAANSRRLARAKPRLRPALREFMRRQRDANHALLNTLSPVVWLVRRSSDFTARQRRT